MPSMQNRRGIHRSAGGVYKEIVHYSDLFKCDSMHAANMNVPVLGTRTREGLIK